MDDVQRVFALLVEVLAESAPARLRSPLEIAEIYQTILPYRQYRSRLQFDTNQDYEMAILRLLAGEGGFASVDPAEVQQALADETQAINPNPGAFRDYAAARVFLNASLADGLVSPADAYAPPAPEPVAAASDEAAGTTPGTDLSNAPTLPFTPVDPDEGRPPPGPPSPPTGRPSLDGLTTFDELGDGVEAPPTSCPSCTRMLPRRGGLRFCPYCGMDVTTPSCRFCGTDLDPDWTFCIACGRQKSAEL